MSPNASVGRLDSAGVVRPWMPLKDENVSEYVSENTRSKKEEEKRREEGLELRSLRKGWRVEGGGLGVGGWGIL